MATAKNDKQNKKSGFDAPVYGYVEKVPEGYKVQVGKDGVRRYVPIKKDSKKK